MKLKINFLLSALLLILAFGSCVKLDYGSSVSDLYDTEWAYKNDDGSIGIKLNRNNEVVSFLINKYGVETVTGTYEYIASSKALSFKGLTWYYSETGKIAFTINGANIIDKTTMKVYLRDGQGNTSEDFFYRQ